jgi:RHS repeat-associated protein
VQGITPERFVHDPAGNLLGSGDARVEGDRLLMQGDPHFRYDAAGDLVEERRGTGGRLVTRYEYDASHRLAAAHTPHGTTRYRYDALGRRVAKTTSSGETRFFWDGATLLGESEEGEARGVGEIAVSTRWYVYEPGSFRPLACVQRGRRVSAVRLAARDGQTLPAPAADATEVFHYHLDHLGTPREMTDARGRIVWSGRYRAWGTLAAADVDEVDNPLRFQGQYHDAETGLHYNFQRYYDPRAGRFVTQDPIGLTGGDNLYAYVANPLSWIDPLGLAREPIEFPPEIVHPGTVTPESPWGIHSYPATGDYPTDRAALVKASGLPRDPGLKYQSHHVDYDPETNTMRGQLVETDYHSTHPHVGGANDFHADTGYKYGSQEAIDEAARRNAALDRASDCG